VNIGQTTDGHRTIAAIVSAAENIKNLDRIRADNQRLADPRTLAPNEAVRMAATHKAVLAIGGSIHATEVGATQTTNEVLYWLATASDAQTVESLQNVIVILIPTLNPDGHRLVVDWYNKNKGTPFEGGPMPWLDHKYAGHDLNRDAFMMNVAENRNIARFFYSEWHPQVFLTIHQMATDGPRFFAPPNVDPIDPNTDPLIWREAALLGSAMTLELEHDHRSGVVSNALYDYYWPGYEDSAPLGHNTVCLLVEAAGVRVASPVTLAAGDLKGGLRGLEDHRRQINFPNPWPGGTWRLRDVVDYELSAVHGLVRAVSAYREALVQNFYEMGARAVEAGRRGNPSAFVIPPDQFDPFATRRLEQLLLQAGVEIFRAIEPFHADGQPYPAGSDIVLLAQPYRAYVKTLLERQEYPGPPTGAFSEGGHPYDVTGWTLPAQMGVAVRTIANRFEEPAMSRVTAAAIEPAKVWGERSPSYFVLEARGSGGAIAMNRLLAANLNPSWLTSEFSAGGYRYPAGSIVVPPAKSALATIEKAARELGLRADGVKGKMPANVRRMTRARVALYRPWTDNTDEGWTRWLLEQYEFPYTTVTDADIRTGNLRARFDAVILPDAAPDELTGGRSVGTAPPEYTGGIGSEGAAALKAFVQGGGSLIALDNATRFAVSTFDLPAKDVARAATREAFFAPGSLLRIDVDPTQPLAYGMPRQLAGFFSSSSAFDSESPSVQTIGRYAAKDLLISGWLQGALVIAGKAAVMTASVGSGRVVLLGFPVQHRAQSLATFRLLFNSIFTSR
jgi:hypothetical protein